MGLSVGIVGLPNVGKSTLFNALLEKQQALAANYPFATIEPNIGMVPVADDRLAKLAEVVRTERIIPSTVEFVDIAGLVAGASKGEGLGNQFLAHIREVDLIVFMLRDFADADVVNTGANPVADLEVLKSELILKDIESVEKKLRGGNFNSSSKLKNLMDRLRQGLNRGAMARELLSNEEREEIRDLFLLSGKPSVAIVNLSEEKLKERGKISQEVRQKTGEEVIGLSAKLEDELNGLDGKDRQEYLGLLGGVSSGLSEVVRVCFEKLGLTSFLTAGEKEVRAWTIKRGAKAPAAAGVIHTDFEKKFIKAKLADYDDFVKFGGWKGAADAGKVRLEGRDYVMGEKDVVEFMIGG